MPRHPRGRVRQEVYDRVGHDVGDDHVRAAGRPAEARPPRDRDPRGASVQADVRPRHGDRDGIAVDGPDAPGPQRRGGDRQNAGARADVEHHRAGPRAEGRVEAAQREARARVGARAERHARIDRDGDLAGARRRAQPRGPDEQPADADRRGVRAPRGRPSLGGDAPRRDGDRPGIEPVAPEPANARAYQLQRRPHEARRRQVAAKAHPVTGRPLLDQSAATTIPEDFRDRLGGFRRHRHADLDPGARPSDRSRRRHGSRRRPAGRPVTSPGREVCRRGFSSGPRTAGGPAAPRRADGRTRPARRPARP